jgi:hypothetical protein
VVRYLEHYSKVSSYAARNAQLTSITLNELTIRAGSQTFKLPFNPPLSSYREARERLVALDKEASTALGRSDITVKEHRLPEDVLGIFFLVATPLTFILLSREENMHPGSLIYDYILKYVPAFAAFAAKVRLPVLYLMTVLHAIEAGYMAKTRLETHSVPVGTWLWWKWVLNAFFEGFPAFQV